MCVWDAHVICSVRRGKPRAAFPAILLTTHLLTAKGLYEGVAFEITACLKAVILGF